MSRITYLFVYFIYSSIIFGYSARIFVVTEQNHLSIFFCLMELEFGFPILFFIERAENFVGKLIFSYVHCHCNDEHYQMEAIKAHYNCMQCKHFVFIVRFVYGA